MSDDFDAIDQHMERLNWQFALDILDRYRLHRPPPREGASPDALREAVSIASSRISDGAHFPVTCDGRRTMWVDVPVEVLWLLRDAAARALALPPTGAGPRGEDPTDV